jgi:signal transduction histidine kinase
MRTPLMSISGYVQTLLERDLDRATMRAFLETAQLEAMRLRRLVDSMYELSLMDLNEQFATGDRCDLQALQHTLTIAAASDSASGHANRTAIT